MFRCPECGKVYKRYSSFMKHLISRHSYMYITEKIDYDLHNDEVLRLVVDRLTSKLDWKRIDWNRLTKLIRVKNLDVMLMIDVSPGGITLSSDTPLPPDKYFELKESLVKEVLEIVDETVLDVKSKEIQEINRKLKEICADRPCQILSKYVVAVSPINDIIILVNLKNDNMIILGRNGFSKLVEFGKKVFGQ